MLSNRTVQTLPPMHQWQHDACVFLHQTLIEQEKEHAYICAPTGSGKSRMMFEACDRLPGEGTRIIIVGRGKIIRQHRRTFREYGCLPVSEDADCAEFISPKHHKILIITWQALRASPLKYWHLLPVAYLFFDECHLGGTQTKLSEEGKSRTSYSIILRAFRPGKRINVSATTQAVNESLLGPKEGHFYRFRLSDAYNSGYLNHVEMIEVHTGIRARIKPLEDSLGKNFEQLEELTGQELHELSRKLKDRAVDVRTVDAVKRIVQHRHDSMMELYFKNHAGEQALFFCPNIEVANEAASRFNAFAHKKGLTGLRSYSVNSENDEHDHLITRFEAGEIRVLHVVGMLQEGFDMPSLFLAFDCRFYRKWDTVRIARLIQKVGRIMRIHPGKPTSRYYYARDVHDFYRNVSNEPTSPTIPLIGEDDEHDAPDGGSEEVTPDNEGLDNQIREAAELAAATVRSDADGMRENPDPDWLKSIDVIRGVVEHHEVEMISDDPAIPTSPGDSGDMDAVDTAALKTKRLTTVRTPLYVLKDVRDYAVVRQENYAKYFGNSASYKKHLILSMPTDSPRPPQNGKQRKHRTFLAESEARDG